MSGLTPGSYVRIYGAGHEVPAYTVRYHGNLWDNELIDYHLRRSALNPTSRERDTEAGRTDHRGTATRPKQQFSKSAYSFLPSSLSPQQRTMSSFHCSKCNFPVFDKQKYHDRLVHQNETSAAFPSEDLQRFQRVLGHFTCPRCADPPFTTPDPSRFQEHVRQCNAPNPDLLPHPPPPPSLPFPFPRQDAGPPPPNSPIPGVGIPRPSFPSPHSTPGNRPPPAHPPRIQPASNIADFPIFRESEFIRRPEPSTITSHPTIPIHSYSLIVNMTLGGVLICMNCGTCVSPKQVVDHIKSHFPQLDIPRDLTDVLNREFGLLPWADIQFPKPLQAPIFGLKILEDPRYFCTRCGHGYGSPGSLRVHQSSSNCPRQLGEVDEHFIGYGQSLGFTSSTFAVDIGQLTRRDASAVEPALLYATTFAPPPDYTRLPVSLTVNTQDLDQFFQREGWIEHLAGMLPAEVNALVDLPKDKDNLYLKRLREYLLKYLEVIQGYIRKHSSHGLMRKMAQVGILETCDELRVLLTTTLREYSAELVRLLFHCMQQTSGAVTSTYYPLTQEQSSTLLKLHSVLLLPSSKAETVAPLLHRSLFLLFAHQKDHGGVSNFELPVISYLVARSMGPSEWIRTTEIGRVVAKLMWGTRAIVLFEMEQLMADERLRSIDAYNRLKKFLTDAEDTVMSYLFNTAALIKSIRGEEYGEANSRISDGLGRELEFKGDYIFLDKFGDLHRGLEAKYDKIIADEIFFGEPLPPWFTITIDMRSLVDDPRNNSAGYCFIDHPQNGFADMFIFYGQWLLSCPIRAAKFADIIDGKIRWKSAPCHQLLRSFSKLRRVLCTRKIVDVGPSARASEIARDLLRNLSGAAIRSVLILFHILMIVGVQDKTSHKILKKRFTPGAMTMKTSIDFTKNLVFFRRFESDLIRYFKGDTHAERYNMYLWPDISDNLSADIISDDLYDATEKFLEVPLHILEYRHVTTAFLRHHNKLGNEEEPDESYDLLANHSTRTSQQRYGVDRSTLANASTHKTMGCVKAAMHWQNLIGISGENPIRLSTRGALSEADVMAIVNCTLQARQTQDDLRLKTYLNETMAELSVIHFPRPPPALLPHDLRPVSSVLVHPSRVAALQQGELIEKLLSRKHHVLGILACDLSKTTILMLLAKEFETHLITLIILPLSGLHRDFQKRTVEYGIPVGRWAPDKTSNYSAKSLIYVSTELAIMDSFLAFAQGLQKRGNLARIVIDEIHIPLVSVSYRAPMAKLIRILGVNTPIVGLTGTLPHDLYPDLCLLTGIDSWNVIRMPSQRPNIMYCAVIAPPAEYIKEAVNYVKNRVQTAYSKQDKAMIFCRTKAIAEDVAKMLGTKAYHAGLTDEQRRDIYDAWCTRTVPWIVCTSILGAGVNEEVLDVVHIDVGHNLIDQVQEDYRAGRNNRPARAIYFMPQGRKPLKADPGKPFGAELLVPWAMNTTECRRIVPSLFLDGQAVTCIMLGNVQFCDNCQRALLCGAPAPPNPIPTPISQRKSDTPAAAAANPTWRLDVATEEIQRTKPASAPTIATVVSSTRPSNMGYTPTRHTAPIQTTIAAPPIIANRLDVTRNDSDDEEEPEVFGIIRCDEPPAQPARVETPPPPPPASSPSWDPMSSASLWQSRPQVAPAQRRDTQIANPPAPRPPHNSGGAPSEVILSNSTSAVYSGSSVTTQIHTANTERAPLAGLSVRISHKAHKKKEDAVETFRKDIATALDTLLLGCAPCWGRGDPNWNLHTTENCKEGIATKDDKFWDSWHVGALRRLEGYCWGCCRLQGKNSGHPYIVDLRDCPWKHLIKAAIYAWVVQPLNADVLVANFVPPEVLASNDFETFWTWTLQPEPAGGRGITNLLRLFHSLALALKLIGTPLTFLRGEIPSLARKLAFVSSTGRRDSATAIASASSSSFVKSMISGVVILFRLVPPAAMGALRLGLGVNGDGGVSSRRMRLLGPNSSWFKSKTADAGTTSPSLETAHYQIRSPGKHTRKTHGRERNSAHTHGPLDPPFRISSQQQQPTRTVNIGEHS
ncbi:hypothetical protein FB451DRAFT_1379456 [Mycena latifolia]|nr:hypothetical protein FB451DRAFT_1379456 [Mycena latifolia]